MNPGLDRGLICLAHLNSGSLKPSSLWARSCRPELIVSGPLLLVYTGFSFRCCFARRSAYCWPGLQSPANPAGVSGIRSDGQVVEDAVKPAPELAYPRVVDVDGDSRVRPRVGDLVYALLRRYQDRTSPGIEVSVSSLTRNLSSALWQRWYSVSPLLRLQMTGGQDEQRYRGSLSPARVRGPERKAVSALERPARANRPRVLLTWCRMSLRTTGKERV